MTAKEAIDYIERHTWSKTRLGLDRTRALLAALGDPQKNLRFVHVAGSNGKGSTCAMLAAILERAGYRVGMYISPYIQEFRERIQVNGQYIPAEALARLTERTAAAADAMEDHPSQFELVTAIGFLYFLEEQCDIVLLEVGMGGALDSTNVIDTPEAAVITNIGLEHTEYLGNTLAEIAGTKAGIIKPGCSAVMYDLPAEAGEVVERVCAEQNVPLCRADFSRLASLSQGLEGQRFSYRGREFELSLLGGHQLRNAAVVLETVEALRARGWTIGEEAVADGLRAVRWPARLELLGRGPLFLLDGGHNPQCAAALAESLQTLLPGRKAVFLAGVLGDKDYPAMLDLVTPLASEFICLTPFSDRALPAGDLADIITARGIRAEAFRSVSEGIAAALEAAGPEGIVVAFGSLYLAGAVRSAYPEAARRFLRRSGIRARDGMDPALREAASRRIMKNILESPEFRRARTVMIYRAVKGEVSLRHLEEAAGAEKRLVYPLCEEGNRLRVLLPLSPDAWRPGPYRIPEPDPARSQEIDPAEIDLVLCPCTAFDDRFSRLGMGGGYYDRFLPLCENAFTAAVAFEAQRAGTIPIMSWDRPVDAVVTEDGFRRP